MLSFPRCPSPMKSMLSNEKQSLFETRKNLTYSKPQDGRGEGKIIQNTFRNIEFIYIHCKIVSHSVHGYQKRDNTLRV